MTRLLIGFFFGLMVAAAVGQINGSYTITNASDKTVYVRNPDGKTIEFAAELPPLPAYKPSLASQNAILMAAQAPDGKASVIKVDAEGRVICSPESQK